MAFIPEITAQKIYMIHCEDCGMLYINFDTANPNESDADGDQSTTTATLADALNGDAWVRDLPPYA